jgi:hypothetical protein
LVHLRSYVTFNNRFLHQLFWLYDQYIYFYEEKELPRQACCVRCFLTDWAIICVSSKQVECASISLSAIFLSQRVVFFSEYPLSYFVWRIYIQFQLKNTIWKRIFIVQLIWETNTNNFQHSLLCRQSQSLLNFPSCSIAWKIDRMYLFDRYAIDKHYVSYLQSSDSKATQDPFKKMFFF